MHDIGMRSKATIVQTTGEEVADFTERSPRLFHCSIDSMATVAPRTQEPHTTTLPLTATAHA